MGRVNRTTKRRESGIVGLTTQQLGYVRSLRAELADPDLMPGYFERKRRDKVVNRAMSEGKPIPQETIEKIAVRYADRLLQLRGETIARTESIAAFQTVQWDGVWQLIDRGATTEAQVTRIWRSARDSSVRDSHAAHNGQEKRLSKPILSPLTGALIQYPHERLGAPAEEVIACRCWIQPKINFLAGFSPGPATS